MAITKTLTMANATGYTMTLAAPGTTKDGFVPTYVSITSAVSCWVKLINWKPSNGIAPIPPADPTPAVGVTSDFYHILAGETKEFGVKRLDLFADPTKFGDMDYFQFISIYSAGAGELRVIAQ